MANPSYVTRSVTILGADGNHLTVSETAERQEVVISIQQNDEHGRIATVRLNHEQFDAFCHTKYELDVQKIGTPAPEVP